MSDDAATVSVIIPTYNRARSIAEAIDSVLAQTVPAHEIIVVDDGSTDETPAILAAYGDRIIVIRQENCGVSAARNAGIARATGEWIGFLDSDDLWLPERLEVFQRDWRAADQDFIAHQANMRFIGKDYVWNMFEIVDFKFPINHALHVEKPFILALKSASPVITIVRRTEMTHAPFFDVDVNFGEDRLAFSRLALSGPWRITSQVVTESRRLPNDSDALSNRGDAGATHRATMETILYERLARLPLTPEELRLINALWATAIFRLASSQRAQHPAAARRTLVRAARRHPSPLKGWTKAALCLALGERGYDIATGGGDRWHRG